MKRMHLLFLIVLLSCGNLFSQSGNALDFDGTDDMVVSNTIPSALGNPGSSDFTIEAWVNPRGSAFTRIFFAQQSTSNFVSLSTNTGNTIYCYVVANGTNYSIATTGGIPQNQWTHVSARWVAATHAITVLFNGVAQAGGSGGSSSTGTSSLMTVGARPGGSQYFNGKLDELRVWGVARTDCEIQNNMNNSITGAQANLLVNYNFNQGTVGAGNTTVTTLPDISGGGYDGSLNNFALSGAGSNWIASTASITTAGNPLGGVQVAQTASVCSGASYTFPDGVTQNNITAPVVHSSTLTGTGCSTVVTTSLSVNPSPVISVNSGSVCSGQSFTIMPAGASTYTYSSGSNVITPTFSALPSVTVMVTVSGTDAAGCVSTAPATSSITVYPLPTLTVSGSSTLSCSGSAVTLSAAGAGSYTWSTGGSGPSISVSPTATTVYSVTGTSSAGCRNNASITQSVTSCTGIRDAESQALALVYPNPTSGLLLLQTDRLSGNAEAFLYDATGRLLERVRLEQETERLNLGGYAKGIYLLRITEGGQRLYEGRIVRE